MLRKLMPQKVENPDLGYIVQSAGREQVEYIEAARSVKIDVDRGVSTGIYRDSVRAWITQEGEVSMSQAEVDMIIDRVDEALQFMGVKTEFEPPPKK